jgi:hypothetical protein
VQLGADNQFCGSDERQRPGLAEGDIEVPMKVTLIGLD